MKLKVCGMRDPDNIEELCSLNPDMMGLIFYPRSPRFFDGTLPSMTSGPDLTGVFVNASCLEILEKVRTYGLKYVQLHGEETPEYCRSLRDMLSEQGLSCQLIKAFPVGSERDLDSTKAYTPVADLFLFDSRGQHRGGNGIAFNWDLLGNYTLDTPYLLSGGIGPGDAPKLLEFTKSPEGQKCIGIDINSLFETSPGQKDIELIRTFKEQLFPVSGH